MCLRCRVRCRRLPATEVNISSATDRRPAAAGLALHPCGSIDPMFMCARVKGMWRREQLPRKPDFHGSCQPPRSPRWSEPAPDQPSRLGSARSTAAHQQAREARAKNPCLASRAQVASDIVANAFGVLPVGSECRRGQRVGAATMITHNAKKIPRVMGSTRPAASPT
jgi:hypothetical protein